MNSIVTKCALVVVILAVLVLIVEGEFFSRSAFVIAGQVAGLTLMAASRAAFRNRNPRLTALPDEGPLIQRGPYRFLRHPMYAGGLLILWTSILGHLSIINAAIGAVISGFMLVRISAEERILRERYPEYETYARRSRRLVPFIY